MNHSDYGPEEQHLLALAAPSFDTYSETFIRDHVRTIAPGQTVLLCQHDGGSDQFGCPVLSPIRTWNPPQTLRQRIVNGFRYRWRVYVDPGLGAGDRRRVFQFLGAHKPRALLAEYGPIGCLLMSVCREANIPLFVHFHGYDASILLRYRHQRRHYHSLFGEASGIIVPSRFLADKLADIGCPVEKLYVSPGGVDPGRFTPTRRLPERLLAVGRLVEKKAPHLTIQAFKQIAGRYPHAQLDMIGDGPLADRCRALVEALGLGDRVRLHGARDSDFVARLMGEASVFVQHSVTAPNGDVESFGVSLVEAMASAVPVVTTRHNGFEDTIDDGITGILVPEHDVDGMAAAIAELLDDPERAARMGEAGRDRVLAHFTLEKSRDRLRAIMGFRPQTNLQSAA